MENGNKREIRKDEGYSSFLVEASKEEEKLKDLALKIKKIKEELGELRDQMGDSWDILKDYFVGEEAKKRAESHIKKSEEKCTPLEADLKNIEQIAKDLKERIESLRREDKKWDALIKDEEESKNFPEA